MPNQNSVSILEEKSEEINKYQYGGSIQQRRISMKKKSRSFDELDLNEKGTNNTNSEKTKSRRKSLEDKNGNEHQSKPKKKAGRARSNTISIDFETKIENKEFQKTGSIETEGRVVYTENEALRHPASLSGGYNQSKWAGEALHLGALAWLPGGAVFRPARVTGCTATGIGPTSDLFATMLAGVRQLGCYPDLTFPFDLTPVDFCAKAMIEVMVKVLGDEGKGMPIVYHLFNQDFIQFKDMFEGERAADGAPLTCLPLDQWRASVRQAPRDNLLVPLTPFLHSDFWDRAPDWPLFSTEHVTRHVSPACRALAQPACQLLPRYKAFFARQN